MRIGLRRLNAIFLSLATLASFVALSGCGSNAPPMPSGAGSGGATAPDATPVNSAEAASKEPNSAGAEIDPALPEYQKVATDLSGSIKSVGSETMNNLMALWEESFAKLYPAVETSVEGKGSSSAPPALLGGTAAFGPMSRRMKPSEIESFESKHGHPPVALVTSFDMPAVFVHRDNAIAGLTFAQVDAIFSKTRRQGGADDIGTWDQAGLTDAGWANQPISIFGRNAASGTYMYFKTEVLGDGDFKDSVKHQGGSAGVVQGVGRDKYAIGYSGIGAVTPNVRAVPLAREEGDPFVAPSREAAKSGTYPLIRELLVYVDYAADKPLDPLRAEFVKFVFSRQGQELVAREGYVPATAEQAKAALASVGLAK